jgi:antitoxin component YwqK of YwqJK toxin-antitoxin module
MKKLVVSLTFCFFIIIGNSQSIKVPDFAQPDVKAFYTEYSNHLIKCIKAIREKNEAKATLLFKAGVPLVKKSRIIEKKVIMNTVEKQKWMQFAGQVSPYIKEMERSAYYKNFIAKNH